MGEGIEISAWSGVAGKLAELESFGEHATCKIKIKRRIVRLIIPDLILDGFIKILDPEDLLIFPAVNADFIVA